MLLLLALGLPLGSCGADEATDQRPPAENERPAPEREDGPGVGDGRGGVELTEIGAFEAPVGVAFAPGEPDAVYVVEQGGTVQRMAEGRSETFLDLSDEVTAGGEQGLLSLAFAPDYERSGLLYVNFTGRDGATHVVELEAERGEVDRVSSRELLEIPQPLPNHNGGLIRFGPDELLYIGTGDGGGAGDPERNARDLGSLLGKLLRIDPDGGEGEPYGIPADNPFADEPDARPELYSYGLRNPWRFSFDRDRGWLSIADVGQDAFEEVNLVDEGAGAGADFGWSAYEGEMRFNEDEEAPDHTRPVLTYPLEDGACAITGGYVVRDERLESLWGRYLYGDFCVGELRSFRARPGRKAEGDRALGPRVPSLSAFGEDGRGRIYATSLEGAVVRLDPEG